MAIKITDNLMNRPMTPGGGSDGTENVTRQFGNQTEQYSRLPNAPDGWGGVANRYAGAEDKATAQAVQAIASSVQDTVQYMDNLRTAEEDSRSKLMFLEIDKKDAEVRSKLDADPEYAKRNTTEQQSIYETERDLEIDKIHQGYGFTQSKVARNVTDNLAVYKARSSEHYRDQIVKPRVIEQSKLNDTASDSLVIDKVSIEPTVDNVASAAQNIRERYDSPSAYAIYGAAGANQLKTQAITRLQTAALNGFQETLEASPLAKLSGPEIDTANLTSGPVSLLAADQKLRASNLIDQLPLAENERLVLKNKAEKYIDQFAKASATDHNRIIKETEQKQKEAMQETLDTWQVSLSMQARNGALNGKQLLSAYNKLTEHPDFKDNPAALKRAFVAMDRVDGERVSYEREQRRLASDRKTRQTIAEMRMDSGIAVSSASADQVFRKNGALKSFTDGGQVVNNSFAQEIEKAGAVPTTVVASITTDLRSSNPQQQQRGVNNLRMLKGFSSTTQNALLRDLPDEYAGVINKLEMGQTAKEAMSFLTRQRPTPDVEKKLRSEAGKKDALATADSVLKDHGWAPKNMSTSMRDQLHTQWEEAYARSGGDTKLAADLFRQDLAKNRKVGTSEFTGKIEQYPASNYGGKEIVTSIINRDLPDTKGKKVVPVFNGMIIVDNKEVPTYKVYTNEDGMLTEATRDGQPFYMTDADTAAMLEEQRAEKLDAGVAAALKRKERDRAAELSVQQNANALKTRPLVDKFGGN